MTTEEKLEKTIKALSLIRDLDSPTQMAIDLDVNEWQLFANALKIIARSTLKEIRTDKEIE